MVCAVPVGMVGSRVCCSRLPVQTREASPNISPRERIMTVAVALTDLAVTTLDEHLALLVDGDVPRTVNRLLLRVVDGGEAVVASPRTPH